MPYSSTAFDGDIASLLQLLQPASICDIGPGAGKYGRLARAVSQNAGFACHTTGVEIDEQYVEHFELRQIYDEIIVDDAVNLISNPGLRYDVAIIGDCIEHMRKSNGVDLINFLVYRCGYILIVYPIEYVQDDWEGHAAEAHISVWGIDDFRNMKVLEMERAGMKFFLIKGYQKSRFDIESITEGSVSIRINYGV